MDLLHRLRLALPDDDRFPPVFLKLIHLSLIAPRIASELGTPEILRSFRDGCSLASRMLVPEAAMHEHGQAVSWKYDIGSARKVFSMKTVTEAE